MHVEREGARSMGVVQGVDQDDQLRVDGKGARDVQIIYRGTGGEFRGV